jgi:hypothetical protein
MLCVLCRLPLSAGWTLDRNARRHGLNETLIGGICADPRSRRPRAGRGQRADTRKIRIDRALERCPLFGQTDRPRAAPAPLVNRVAPDFWGQRRSIWVASVCCGGRSGNPDAGGLPEHDIGNGRVCNDAAVARRPPSLSSVKIVGRNGPCYPSASFVSSAVSAWRQWLSPPPHSARSRRVPPPR